MLINDLPLYMNDVDVDMPMTQQLIHLIKESLYQIQTCKTEQMASYHGVYQIAYH